MRIEVMLEIWNSTLSKYTEELKNNKTYKEKCSNLSIKLINKEKTFPSYIILISIFIRKINNEPGRKQITSIPLLDIDWCDVSKQDYLIRMDRLHCTYGHRHTRSTKYPSFHSSQWCETIFWVLAIWWTTDTTALPSKHKFFPKQDIFFLLLRCKVICVVKNSTSKY